jgi:hypothetical protein
MRGIFGVGLVVALLGACETGSTSTQDAAPGVDGPVDVNGQDFARQPDVGSEVQTDQRTSDRPEADLGGDAGLPARDAASTAPDTGSDSAGAAPIVSFESVCSAQAGAAVSFSQPSIFSGCSGLDEPTALLVIESGQQLANAIKRFPCLDTPAVQSISFAARRLVVAPVRGEVRWVNQVGDGVVIAVTLYGGPAPGSQPFPIAVNIPRADQIVRARYCPGASGCAGTVCPP